MNNENNNDGCAKEIIIFLAIALVVFLVWYNTRDNEATYKVGRAIHSATDAFK